MSIKSNLKSEFIGYKDVKIVCPICKKIDTIQIPEMIINESNHLTTIQIPKYRVCDHIIIPFIDKNFNVRGYQKVDYVINSDITLESKINIENINLFTLKINIDYLLFVNLLSGVFHRFPILIIIDDKLYHKKQDLNSFLGYIFDNLFETNINVELKSDFKNNRDIYKDFLILEGKKVKNYKIPSRDLSFEESFIKEFYSELDDKKSITNLRNRIREVNILCHKILKIYQQEGEGIRGSVIINYIENTQFIRISKHFFNFLINIIEKYFKVRLIFAKDILGDKLSELWGRNI
ncbi:MAG: hypothetical protein JXA99_06915 [Candidatus Lokiarchaeota archaeon]|nr:hypothetical protein [Candidatus Lokiarchaeota archaeon]